MTDLMNAKVRRDNRDSTEDHILSLEDVIEDIQAVIIQLMHRVESLEKKTGGEGRWKATITDRRSRKLLAGGPRSAR